MKKTMAILLALVMVFALSSTVFAAEAYNLGTTASAFSENIKADGIVTEEEWGEPVIVTGPEDAWAHNATDKWDYWQFFAPADMEQRVKIYVTNDNENIYLAMTMDKASDNMSACPSAGDLWGYAHFGFNIGQYTEGTLVPQIEAGGMMHDQWTGYFFGMVNGAKGQLAQAHGLDPKELPAENYEIKYDATAKTWTYEVILPMSYTNIDLEKSQDIAISFDMADGKLVDNGGNRYHITQGYFNSQNFDTNCYCEVGMEEGGALKISLNEKVVDPDAPVEEKPEYYVLDKAQKAGTIKIDGSISEEEWGKPVMYSNPLFVRENIANGLYWEIDGVVKEEQEFKFWLTNDDENIYLALALENAQNNTVKIEKPEDLWNGAHFAFTFGQYNKDTTVDTFEYKVEHGGDGLNHEIFNSYWIGLVNGEKGQWCVSHGQDRIEIAPENYEIKFDEATSTWIYEVKIPLADTKLNLNANQDIAVSFGIADGNTGSGANRYLVTTGFEESKNMSDGENCICEIGMHKGGALKFTMFGTPATGDISVIAVVAVVCVAALGVASAIVLKKRTNR